MNRTSGLEYQMKHNIIRNDSGEIKSIKRSRRKFGSGKGSVQRSPAAHLHNNSSMYNRALREMSKNKKKKNSDSNPNITKSNKKKLPRRVSMEDLRRMGSPNENLFSIQEQENDYSKRPLKSPNGHKNKIMKKFRKGKSNKSGDSSRNLPIRGGSSLILPGSTHKIQDMHKIYNFYSPSSGGLQNSQFSTITPNYLSNTAICSPSSKTGLKAQMLSTSQTLAKFKDISKRVSKHLGAPESKGTPAQKQAIKKSKVTLPPGKSKYIKYQCPKKEKSGGKQRGKPTGKISTRGKQKQTHSNNYKHSLSQNEFMSLKNNHTLQKYIQRGSNNQKQFDGSYEDSRYYTVDIQNNSAPDWENLPLPPSIPQMPSDPNLEEELRVKEELQEIGRKLEKDHKSYLDRKQSDSGAQDPEKQIKLAAEIALDNLSESQAGVKPVLELIKKCYTSYIDTMEHNVKELKGKLDQKDKTIDNFETKIKKFETELSLKVEEVSSLKLEISQKISSIKALEEKCTSLEKNLGEKTENFMSNYDQKKICSEIKDLLSENDDLKTYAGSLKSEMSSELAYSRQRENKLMYFLFLLQQKDYPVFDVFEKYISKLDTDRFSTELDEDYKNIYIEQMRKLKQVGLLERDPHKSFNATDHDKL